jgi:hypothetical protein
MLARLIRTWVYQSTSIILSLVSLHNLTNRRKTPGLLLSDKLLGLDNMQRLLSPLIPPHPEYSIIIIERSRSHAKVAELVFTVGLLYNDRTSRTYREERTCFR